MTRTLTSKIAIIGAGPIGCATLAHLSLRGHVAALYSPTARRVERNGTSARFRFMGATEGELEVELLSEWYNLRAFDTLIVCLPANVLQEILPQLAQIWRGGQQIIVSGALALSPLKLYRQAQENGVNLTVTGWGTTLTTAHFLDHACIHINAMRRRIDMASIGAKASEGAKLCEELFGKRFSIADNLLAPTLANINPIAHAAEVIPNLTRIDKGEEWSLFGNFTQPVARIADALDLERLEIAKAFAIELPTLREHYANSYGVAQFDLATMAREIVDAGMSPSGPATLEHRYVVEDTPFGLVFLEELAKLGSVPTPILSACITMLETVYDRSFRSQGEGNSEIISLASDPASLYTLCMADRMAETPARPESPCR